MTHPCSEPGCARTVMAHGLCKPHYERQRLHKIEAARTTRPTAPDEPHMPCPADCLDLAAACAELDARAIVRAIWPHLLDASIAGRQPFTLEPA